MSPGLGGANGLTVPLPHAKKHRWPASSGSPKSNRTRTGTPSRSSITRASSAVRLTCVPDGIEPLIEKAIRNLASDAFKQREDASKELLQAGHWAYAALQKASASPELEVAKRAQSLLNRILEKTPPDILKMRADVGMVFQENALFDSLTVGENVGYRLYEETRMPLDEVRKRVEEVLAFLGLSDFIDTMPSSLSGGQRRRVGIGRAMASKPHLMLFDDSTTGLDPVISATVDDEIVKLRDRLNAANGSNLVPVEEALVSQWGGPPPEKLINNASA
jgi:energy-coupling factor transporter ATP-binding protein EcfA2